MIDDLRRKLLFSRNHNNMLLNGIAQHRYRHNRVPPIVTRLNDAQDARDIPNMLEQLVREDVLSHEQYPQRVELEELDLVTVVEAIKGTKV